MRDKKIVFIHPMVRTYRLDWFNMLGKEKNVQFIFTSSSYYEKILELMPHVKFKYEVVQQWPNPVFSEGFNPFLFLKLIKYDIIISSIPYSYPSIIAFIIAKIFGKKIIFFDETWMLPDNLRYNLIKPLFKFMIKRADANIVSGTAAKNFYIKLGVDQSKISIAKNSSIDYNNFDTSGYIDKQNNKKDQSKNKIIILYLGRIVKYKGLDLLIRAFAKLELDFPNVSLLVAGDGSFKSFCENLAVELKIKNIQFVGEVDENSKVNYYIGSDIFVLPARFMQKENVCCEAWGMTINEAMSCGKPIIATDAVGGAYDLIENGVNGVMIKSDDEKALLSSLKDLVKDEKLRINMGDLSKKKIKKEFNHENTYKIFKNVIESFISS